MKKFLLSIVTVLYLAMSSGIAMDIHYCMGKRAGVDLYDTADDKCGRCGMTEKENGCCHDEHQFYKLEDSHKNVFNDINFDVPVIAVVTAYPLFNWQAEAIQTAPVLSNKAPPDDIGPGTCIMNCVFRI